MTQEALPSLSPEELDAETAEKLPDREVMSLLLPGATLETAAGDNSLSRRRFGMEGLMNRTSCEPGLKASSLSSLRFQAPQAA